MTDEEKLARTPTDGNETIVRALHAPFWDSQKGKGTPSAFTGNNISVSRESVLTREEIIAIFKLELETPSRSVEAIAITSVQHVVLSSVSEQQKTYISVVNDPIKTNAAHAEIMATDKDKTEFSKITRGMANKILDGCTTSIL